MATSQASDIIRHLRATVLSQDGAEPSDAQLLERHVSRRDEAALAALVKRHAPMVWGVCRRVLRNPHDAEDAFQATFLVLVRKAAAIASRDLLANWLYGVAHQTALNARARAARRADRERQVTPMPDSAAAEPGPWDDLQPLLDQELSRLPARYRAPLIVCDLEGKTRKEAARQLGCPEGTVAGRLARGRALLAKRLARQGLALSAGTLAAVLARSAASAAVPPAVVSSTIQAATLLAAGPVAAGLISAPVAALTEGVLKTMFLTRIKTATAALLLAVIVLGVTAGLLITPAAGQPAPPAAGAPDGPKHDAKVKWEYKAVNQSAIEKLAGDGSKDKLTDGLNALGEQGWELVAIQPGAVTGGFGAIGGGAGGGPGAGGGGVGPGLGGGGIGAPPGGGFGPGGGVMMAGPGLGLYLFKRLK